MPTHKARRHRLECPTEAAPHALEAARYRLAYSPFIPLNVRVCSFNEISHTKSARNMLKDYLKGPMRPSELDKLRRSKPGKAKVSKAATATTGAKADAEGSSTLSTYLPYLIPLAMLISALYFHFFSGKTAAAAPGQTEL